jgi:hypothetical protein
MDDLRCAEPGEQRRIHMASEWKVHIDILYCVA